MAEKCPNCGSHNIVYDAETGERVCHDCGFVIEKFSVDLGPEYRVFLGKSREEGERKVRVGPPESFGLYDKGLSTRIGAEDFIKEFKPSQRAQLRRMKKRQKWVVTTGERWRMKTLGEIERLSEKLGLPRHVVETAAMLAHKLSDEKYVSLRRGRYIREIAPALILYAARKCEYPLPEREITSVVEPERKGVVRKVFRELQRAFGKVPPLSPKVLI